MYPTILMLHEDLAQIIIDYRVNRIPEAEAKAASYNAGYKGAMFPW